MHRLLLHFPASAAEVDSESTYYNLSDFGNIHSSWKVRENKLRIRWQHIVYYTLAGVFTLGSRAYFEALSLILLLIIINPNGRTSYCGNNPKLVRRLITGLKS